MATEGELTGSSRHYIDCLRFSRSPFGIIVHYVYVLKSQKDNRLYVSFTSDLRKCLFRHNDGQVPATKKRLPLKLIYYEAYRSEKDARKRGLDLKQYANSYSRLKRRIKGSQLSE